MKNVALTPRTKRLERAPHAVRLTNRHQTPLRGGSKRRDRWAAVYLVALLCTYAEGLRYTQSATGIAMSEIQRIGQLIDRYYSQVDPIDRCGVASTSPSDHGVPREMWAAPVDSDGWVDWKLLPSTLTNADVSALESEFGVSFPPSFQAYLQARFHCFDQVRSARYDEAILWPAMPAHDPLRALRELLKGWRALISADLIPFAQWGDGYGPMCFDSRRRRPDGDCPILWLDHELIAPMGQKAALRANLTRLEQPLYDSFVDLLQDVFGGEG